MLSTLKFSSVAPAAVGASLRSPMRLSGSPAAVAAAAMPQPARPKAGPTKRQGDFAVAPAAVLDPDQLNAWATGILPSLLLLFSIPVS